MFKLKIDNNQLINYNYDHKSNMSDQNSIDSHEKMVDLKCNWKLIGIIGAFVNRIILGESHLNTNVSVKDKKPELLQELGDPTVLNISNVDMYNVNLIRHIHQTIDSDLQYLADTTTDFENTASTPAPSQSVTHLLNGLVVLNEHLSNFISFGYENMYDQKIKKVIDYFTQQRDYYLSICRVKAKFGV
jgi:hypothetical protein